MIRIDLLGVLWLALFALVAGWLATRQAEEPESNLFAKGIGFMLLGGFTVWISSVPLPLPQFVGAAAAAGSRRNRASRWAAYAVGLVGFLIGVLLRLQ
jgi:hypothetical protein